jgi:hypothetical protein
MELHKINIKQLPFKIQNQLPFSIRTKKTTYSIEELPYNIRYMIKEYVETTQETNQERVLDYSWGISSYGDLNVIDEEHQLILEYIRTYVLLKKGSYPFDPTFYSKLYTCIHVTDSSVQHTLVSGEINRLIEIISQNLSIPIKINNLNINKIIDDISSCSYNINIDLTINGKQVSNFNIDL